MAGGSVLLREYLDIVENDQEDEENLPIAKMRVEGVPFTLPTSVVEYYDDPTENIGDEGWSLEELEADIRQHGVQEPILVAKSLHQMEKGGHDVYAFNGNHRLAVARKLGIRMIPCMAPSWADDAEPLSVEEIETLGGDARRIRSFLAARGYRD